MSDIDTLSIIFGTFTYLRERGIKGIYYYHPHGVHKKNINIVPDPLLNFIYNSPLKSRFANDDAP